MGAVTKLSETSFHDSIKTSDSSAFGKTTSENGGYSSIIMEGRDGVSRASNTRCVKESEGALESKALQRDRRDKEHRPPLPPRPMILRSSDRPVTSSTEVPQMQSQATTALSPIDIQTLSFPDGTRGTFSTISHSKPISISGSRRVSQNSSDVDDSTSLMSYAPTSRAAGDLNSLVGDRSNAHSPAWRLLSAQADSTNPFESIEYNEDDCLSTFEREFDEIPETDSKGGNEGWRPLRNEIPNSS
jgi:vacuolar fusion protein MON1